MAIATSPLAVALPEMPPIAGVRLGAIAAGIRYKGRTDVVMAELAAGTTVAGVFTSSKCPGAPVYWCRAALEGGKARAGVITAGNANVFSGKAGAEAERLTAFAAGKTHEFKVKTLGPLRWRSAGQAHDLRLIVIAPLGYRLTKNGRLLYRKAA